MGRKENLMNHWQYEQYKQIDEYNRQRMMVEIRADRLVQQYHIYHPGIFEGMKFKFANWMIAIGNGLRRRYEIPSANGNQKTSRNLI